MAGRKKSRSNTSGLARAVLGYLNLSSGARDPQFLKNFSDLFAAVVDASDRQPPRLRVAALLRAELSAARDSSDAFRHAEQAEAVIGLALEELPTAYLRFHADLLFHQSDAALCQPFFLGRCCEAVLRQGGPWDQTERIVAAALNELNDYIGYRPVAVLHNEQKIQPYAHEWVCPVPLWIRGAGAAAGPYRELVETALAILDAAEADLLAAAQFPLEQLDELVMDPRADDFEHPVSHRPNYWFGQWDMHKLDNAGLCRRFVLQQTTLDGLLQRLAEHGDAPRQQVLFEEAAVLAGTMLMGAGVSGARPDAHDSTVSLAVLMPRIAAYRDEFYSRLLRRMPGAHGRRLLAEARELQQPFGGARQHFNHYLARRRANQLQHVHLAGFYAALGCPDLAEQHATVVPAASARMLCRMRCRTSLAHLAVERGQLEEAAAALPEVEDLLRRAIECGAMVDPWNILGFGGQFSLFPAVENSVVDTRVDVLLDTMSDIFGLYGRIHKAAAAAGKSELREKLSAALAELTRWWDQFATTEVGSVEGISGGETLASTESVAEALAAWHQGGAAAGDVGFWRRWVEGFRSPKAFAAVVETLLDHGDFVAAMALLVQWLSQSDEVPLVEEDYSFHDLALAWMEELWGMASPAPVTPARKSAAAELPPQRRWELARKFLDFIEANAGSHWRPPRFDLAGKIPGEGARDDEWPDNDDFPDDEYDEEFADERSDGLFGAAYDDVVYRDSAADGVEGQTFEGGPSDTEMELVGEAERIVERLGFLSAVAQLWKLAATASISGEAPRREETLAAWLEQARSNLRQLQELLSAVSRHEIDLPGGSQESIMEYDRRRSVRDTLLEEIVGCGVEMADAARLIRATMSDPPAAADAEPWEAAAEQALAAALRGETQNVARGIPKLLSALVRQPLLYRAVARGGNPRKMLAARGRQMVIRRLLEILPRLGLLTETFRLLETAQAMEVRHPVGPGAITEYDDLFAVGCEGIVRCAVLSATAAKWSDAQLVELLEQLAEALLNCWLTHSRQVRLSVVETLAETPRWRALKGFIRRYGADLFTQQFMNPLNLRGILHQGAENFLKNLRDEPDGDNQCRLVAELDGAISLEEAAGWLSLIAEAVVENYAQYVDYNGITTQSDRGDMLYTLLDFLRLQAHYNRMAWNLRPVELAHRALVRCGRRKAAGIWRRAVRRRTARMADWHQRVFESLCRRHGMRLPSIAQRLAQRFVEPLRVDRLCALLRPAVAELRAGRRGSAVRRLQAGIDRFAANPSGAGHELPDWLVKLDEELDAANWTKGETERTESDYCFRLPQSRLSTNELRRQIKLISERAK
jgi:hypothetical protein